MSAIEKWERTRRRAQELLSGPPWTVTNGAEREAFALLEPVRNSRDFSMLEQLCERLARNHPRHALLRKFQTQALIETGHITAAIDVAKSLLRGMPESDPQTDELHGLVGRAYKQIALEATGADAAVPIREALAAYGAPCRRDPGNTWHATNLAAVLTYAKRLEIDPASDLDPRDIATRTISTLHSQKRASRDLWWAASMAECHIALDEWDAVEHYLKDYLLDPEVTAFAVGATLRQFSEIWGLGDSGDRRQTGILQCMQMRLLQLPDVAVSVPAVELGIERERPSPSKEQLEAILGTAGTKTLRWWKAGLRAATSVAAIHKGFSGRRGTGFAVSAADFGKGPPEERLLLTNYHVVNGDGSGVMQESEARIAFESVDPDKKYRIKEILWSSPVARHDACLMRLEGELPDDVEGLPLASNLPPISATTRVYVIGHPSGRELEFSFQDNVLLDHEGPASGTPPIEGVCRLHYRARTENGSSGSPVFNADNWEAVAIHHAGDKMMQALNGKSGILAANEGMALRWIAKAVIAGSS